MQERVEEAYRDACEKFALFKKVASYTKVCYNQDRKTQGGCVFRIAPGRHGA